jgi:hypothetical protein
VIGVAIRKMRYAQRVLDQKISSKSLPSVITESSRQMRLQGLLETLSTRNLTRLTLADMRHCFYTKQVSELSS